MSEEFFNYAKNLPSLQTRYFLKYSEMEKILAENFPEETKSTTYNIFFDTRSCLPSVFTEEGMNELVKNYKHNGDKFLYARSIILLLNHWSRFFRKKGRNFNLIMFSEQGDSVYHTKLSKTYKKKRALSKLKAVDYDSRLLNSANKLIDYNIETLDFILNKVPDCYFINLKHLEADFVPHYVKNKFELNNDNNVSLIISSDKDLTQSLDFHTIQIAKKKDYEVYNTSNAIDSLGTRKLKNFKFNKLRTHKSIPLLLALMGDKEDGIDGLKGVGLSGAYSYLDKLLEDGMLGNDFNWTAGNLIEVIKIFKLEDKVSKGIMLNQDSFLIDFKLASFDELISQMNLNNITHIDSVIRKEGKFLCENVTAMDLRNTLLQICIYENSFSSLLK